jgi:zinc transporter ZupT
MLGGNNNEIIDMLMWVIGGAIVILMFLEMITIDKSPTPLEDKRDWCKTKEKDEEKEF